MRLEKVSNVKGMKSDIKSIAKVVVFAVDIEELDIKKSFNDQVTGIVVECQNLNIPYYFSCTRKEIGTALYGRKNIHGANVSAIAIIDPSGLENVK